MALRTLPRSAGGACPAVRSKAEPGNEESTRFTMNYRCAHARVGVHGLDFRGKMLLNYAPPQLERRRQLIMFDRESAAQKRKLAHLFTVRNAGQSGIDLLTIERKNARMHKCVIARRYSDTARSNFIP